MLGVTETKKLRTIYVNSKWLHATDTNYIYKIKLRNLWLVSIGL